MVGEQQDERKQNMPITEMMGMPLIYFILYCRGYRASLSNLGDCVFGVAMINNRPQLKFPFASMHV